MATDLEVCNLALGHLGQTILVSDITVTGTLKEEKLFYRVYANAKRRLMIEADWTFLRRRAVLAEATAASVTDPDWSFFYNLPSDLLAIRRLESFRNLAPEERNRYKVRLNDAGTAKVLCCDLAPDFANNYPALYYTAEIAPSLWPEYFVDALAWKLAEECCIPLRVEQKLAGFIMQRSLYAIQNAVGADFNIDQPDEDPEGSYIRARN